MLPLLMYISFEADFRGLRPWLPHHYVRIARRTFSALANNRGKVTEKNL